MRGTTLNKMWLFKMKLNLFSFKGFENHLELFRSFFYLYDINTEVFLLNHI